MIIRHHYVDMRCLIDLTTPALKMLGVDIDFDKHMIRMIDDYEYVDSDTLEDFIKTYISHIIQESKINEGIKEYLDYALVHAVGIDMEDRQSIKHIFHVNNMGLDEKSSALYSDLFSEFFSIRVVVEDIDPIDNFDMFTTFIRYDGLKMLDYMVVTGDFVKDEVSEQVMFTPLFLQEIHSGIDIKLLMSQLRDTSKGLINIEFIPIDAMTTKK